MLVQSEAEFLVIRCGTAFESASLPRLGMDDFQSAVSNALEGHCRIVSLFCTDAYDGPLRLVAVLADDRDGVLRLASAEVPEREFPSMAERWPSLQLFEREIAESWSVRPLGHPWLKPVRFPSRTLDKSRDAVAASPRVEIGDVDFYRVDGDEVHEVAVGPVHAGVIEPGHFRFQCHGERVFHLEISLGYQHRGVERAMVGRPTGRTLRIAETIAGDTTIGHATAYCQAIESLSGTRVSGRAQLLRAIALELERAANHVGGLGALAMDVGFLPTASFCGRLRGDVLNLTAELCGSRFGRTLVVPGGVAHDVDEALSHSIREKLRQIRRDVEGALSLLWGAPSVAARFERTGTVALDVARALGLVGVAARASGLDRDVRRDHPSGAYRLQQIPTSVALTGDVFARARVRALELQRSFQFIMEQLAALPRGATHVELGSMRPSHGCVTLAEGWRGEVCHVAFTDAAGAVSGYKVVDPSFHNWAGLAMALRDQDISDFPLCNKSFDLSYCGYDL